MELTEKKKIKEYREEILKILNNTIEKIELEQYYSVEKTKENFVCTKEIADKIFEIHKSNGGPGSGWE